MELEKDLEDAEAKIERLILRISQLEKRLDNFNLNRTISWRNQGDI
jgi:hypothetical protein